VSTPSVDSPGAAARVVPAATCLGCGCACDDIDVVVSADRIVEARRACSLGVAWFGDGRVPTRCLVDGRNAPVEAAIHELSQLLVRSASPLVYLAPELSCEAQREAIALADALHASLDTVTSAIMRSMLASQERGRASATLGEIRHRGDVVMFWGVDPAARYPRYWTRYAPEPVGQFVPEGRRSRTLISVDVGDSRGPDDADLRVAVSAEDEVATLTALRAMVSSTSRVGSERSEAAPWSRARELAPRLLDARYAVIVHDAEPWGEADEDRADALITLAQALNGPTRCALSTLRAGGNRSGADAVATSQTGYPTAIDFTRRYPRYRPYDGTALMRFALGEVDVALFVGAVAEIPPGVIEAMQRPRCALLGPRASESPLAASAAVVIDCGIAGIHEGGTALRMDDVPLPLRSSLGVQPSARSLLRDLRERVLRAETTP
jgi:formylmethanofuran dehydrogenase subunit B